MFAFAMDSVAKMNEQENGCQLVKYLCFMVVWAKEG